MSKRSRKPWQYSLLTCNKLLIDIESKIKHLTYYNPNLAPYCEKFDILEETLKDQQFTTATTPVRKIIFKYKRLKQIIESNEMINDSIKDYVQSVCVYDFSHEMEINPTIFVTEWINSYPNCQKYSISFERCGNKEIKSLLQLSDMNIKKLSK